MGRDAIVEDGNGNIIYVEACYVHVQRGALSNIIIPSIPCTKSLSQLLMYIQVFIHYVSEIFYSTYLHTLYNYKRGYI